MSKGLGKLQRDILAYLDSPGCEVEERVYKKGVFEKRRGVGVYDLRCVARRMARPGVTADRGGFFEDSIVFPYYPKGSYSAAFSRAVQALIRRGELEVVDRRLWDGSLSRQNRFVRRRSKTP